MPRNLKSRKTHKKRLFKVINIGTPKSSLAVLVTASISKFVPSCSLQLFYAKLRHLLEPKGQKFKLLKSMFNAKNFDVQLC